MKNQILLTVAVSALTLTFAASSRADQPFLSPRAGANQSRVAIQSPVKDVNVLSNMEFGNAKARELAYSSRTVAASGPRIDLAHGPRPALSPKDPQYAQSVREAQFQIAPLK